jgi:hypothetical protein
LVALLFFFIGKRRAISLGFEAARSKKEVVKNHLL